MKVSNGSSIHGDRSSDSLPTESAGKIIRILVVDDEQEFASTLCARLRKRGYHTDVAFNGRDALERVGRDACDAVLLDLNMPGIHGMEVLRRIRKAYPRIQVIIITGYTSDVVRSAAMLSGAFELFTKPVDFNALLDALRRACAAERHPT